MDTLKPCKCGYDGALAGIRHKEGYLSLHCPKCNLLSEQDGGKP